MQQVEVELRPLGGQLDPRALDEVIVKVDGKVLLHVEGLDHDTIWAGVYDAAGEELHALSFVAAADGRLVLRSDRY